MYILFEEHQYQSNLVEKILKDIYVLQDVNKMVSVQYVGYFYNPHLHDCVFILPKVLLKEDDTLVGFQLQSGVDVKAEQVLTPEGQKELSQEFRKFIYEFSVWIYRALNEYHKYNPKSKIILYKHLPQSGKGARQRSKTYLDIVLSLISFNQANQDYVLFTIKNLHRGNNKINWTQTINKTQTIIQGKDALYLTPINKKRIINYEEELFVIFFSILNFLNKEYGFKTPINFQYDLIVGKQFEQYRKGLGKMRLMQIKYKYFSDKALQLWDLCYAFFDSTYRISINTSSQEYILAKDFHVVFEAMIDELIGTPHDRIPKGLADQEDGKRIDHIYTDLALTSADTQKEREVYYIGDSKYYKSGNKLTSESIYKQYTYARNVIQWNVNLFAADDSRFDATEKNNRIVDKKNFGDIHLQDNELTEGYDVIPNFFISAYVSADHLYDDGKSNIRKHTSRGGHCTKVSFQFPDRLFDRDTLFLSQYDVNFLYVLYLYGRNKANEKAYWKQYVRKQFREEIREVIRKEFTIYAMKARLGVDGAQYFKQHFYELNGRVFQPYGEERSMFFAYARPTQKMDETKAQYEELKKYFIIQPCDMGKDPLHELQGDMDYELQHPNSAPLWLPIHYLERDKDRGVLLGYYKNEDHLKWMLGNNDKGSLIYNVRLSKRDDSDPRDGAHSANFYDKQDVYFAILYTDGYDTTNQYRVFLVKDTAKLVTEERMRKTGYPFNAEGNYFFFRFFEEVSVGKLDIAKLISDLKEETKAKFGKYVEYEPMFTKAEKVIPYRLGF